MIHALKQYSYQKNKHFYHSLFKIAIPIGLSSLLGSLLNIVDTWMITGLDSEGYAVSAVGSSNKLFFIMTVTLYGVFSGFGVFISQYWGKKDLKRLQTVFMTSLGIGILISTIFTIIAAVFPHEVIKFFIDDPNVIALGVPYLRIVSLSYTISAILFSVEMVSRSTENVRLPMTVSIIGVLINTLLNYTLIYGNFGFKEMGVEGAAIATLTSRIIQLTIYITYTLITKHQVLYININNFIFDKTLFKKMTLRVIPVVGNEFFWSLGISLIFAAYGRKGPGALASMQVFDSYVSILTVFTWGVANSSSVLLGKRLGENNLEETKKFTKLFIFTSIVVGITTSLLILASIPILPFIFTKLSQQIITDIQYLLAVFALYMPFKQLAATFIVGILRSAGDTIYALVFEIVSLWGYAVPMSYLLVILTPLSLPLIYLIITLEEVIKVTLCFIRYKTGKYIHNLVH